jgi:MOSC domain-containing protein YiiM
VKVVSINVGLPREVIWNGRRVTTGIFKEPIDGPVMVRRLNIEGDRQADLSVHGGKDKAVYSYPAEHYEYWRRELPGMNLPWGMFGENLTTEGLVEEDMNIGDMFRIGSAVLMVTQPRMPCYKLGIKFGRSDIVKRFLKSGYTGFYFSVIEEGEMSAGSKIEIIGREEKSISIADLIRLYTGKVSDPELLRRAIKIRVLPENWKNHLLNRIVKISK